MESATVLTPDNIFVFSVKEGNYVNTFNILAANLTEAITKCKDYCTESGSRRRYIGVRPFITDLDHKLAVEKVA